MTRGLVWAGLLSLGMAAAACGGGEPETSPADASSAAAAAGVFTPEPVTLREGDVERFLTVMREFKRLGLETEARGDPGQSVSAMATAWGANREAMDILRQNDFEMVQFQRVAYSIMAALAASEMEGSDAKMQEGAAQLEAMKDKLPKEMYEAMKKTQEQATQMTQSFMRQPEGNVELVRRFRADIEALNR